VLSARHRSAVVAVALSLTSTLLLDEALAQSVAPQASAPPTSPMLPASAEPATVGSRASEPTETTGASKQDAYTLEGTTTVTDRVVLKPPPSTRWLLVGAGLGVTSAFYVAGYGIGEMWPDAPGKVHLKVPVAGPILDLAHTGCPKNDSDCSKVELVVRTVLITLDALGQVGGVGLLLEGALFSPSGVEPPRTGQNYRLTRRAESPSIVAVPWTDGQTGIGLGLAGRF
jgi:hypothetical protein